MAAIGVHAHGRSCVGRLHFRATARDETNRGCRRSKRFYDERAIDAALCRDFYFS
jgi:hypothetical protein